MGHSTRGLNQNYVIWSRIWEFWVDSVNQTLQGFKELQKGSTKTLWWTPEPQKAQPALGNKVTNLHAGLENKTQRLLRAKWIHIWCKRLLVCLFCQVFAILSKTRKQPTLRNTPSFHTKNDKFRRSLSRKSAFEIGFRTTCQMNSHYLAPKFYNTLIIIKDMPFVKAWEWHKVSTYLPKTNTAQKNFLENRTAC